MLSRLSWPRGNVDWEKRSFWEEIDVLIGIRHEGECEAGKGQRVVWPPRKKKRDRGPQAQKLMRQRLVLKFFSIISITSNFRIYI